MSAPPRGRGRRELAHRVSGGTEVALYWSADDDSTSIEIRQAATGVTIELAVPREHALDAFYHPFAHVLVGEPDGLAVP
jgi:hypothetical protein